MIKFLKKYFAALYIPIIWTLIIVTLMCLPGSALPNESNFKIPQFDKLVHAGVFGGFVFLWGLYTSKRRSELRVLLTRFFIFYLLGCAYGIAMEFVQLYWIPGRDFDVVDMLADVLGAGIGYGLCHLLLLLPEAKSS